MVAGGRQCASRSTITPSKTCATDIYRLIKRRVSKGYQKKGTHLNERTARGTWSLPESKLHINHLELKKVFLALKEFQDLFSNNIVLVATDNTTVVAYINKEGGMKSGSLCALHKNIKHLNQTGLRCPCTPHLHPLYISPATMSSWIKQTVILCYELSDQRAHNKGSQSACRCF